MNAMPKDPRPLPPAAAGEAVLWQVGVLPWKITRKKGLRVLLITSRTRGRWIVPKGWPEEARAPFMSAALEAFEEAGVIGDIHPAPLTDYRSLKIDDDGMAHPCRVTLFAMQVRGTLTHWKEQDQRKRRWFGLAEAAERLDDAELAAFVERLASAPEQLTDRAGRLPAVPAAL